MSTTRDAVREALEDAMKEAAEANLQGKPGVALLILTDGVSTALRALDAERLNLPHEAVRAQVQEARDKVAAISDDSVDVLSALVSLDLALQALEAEREPPDEPVAYMIERRGALPVMRLTYSGAERYCDGDPTTTRIIPLYAHPSPAAEPPQEPHTVRVTYGGAGTVRCPNCHKEQLVGLLPAGVAIVCGPTTGCGHVWEPALVLPAPAASGAEPERERAMAPVSKDSPLWRSWEAYRRTPAYANAARWAVQAAHTEGSLWAAFEAGFSAGASRRLSEIVSPGSPRPAAPSEGERVTYWKRCGWCGAYEGTVDPEEPCAKDASTGDYIGPHQFGVYERVSAREGRGEQRKEEE